MNPSRRLSSDRVSTDRVVVGFLGVGERDPRVDFERLACGVPGVGLDQRVIDSLGFQPGE